MGEYFLNLEETLGFNPYPCKREKNVFLKMGKEKKGQKDSGLSTSEVSFTAQSTEGKRRSNSCVFLSVQCRPSLGDVPVEKAGHGYSRSQVLRCLLMYAPSVLTLCEHSVYFFNISI